MHNYTTPGTTPRTLAIIYWSLFAVGVISLLSVWMYWLGSATLTFSPITVTAIAFGIGSIIAATIVNAVTA